MIKKILLLVPMIICSIPVYAENDKINQYLTHFESSLIDLHRNGEQVNPADVLLKMGGLGFFVINQLALQEASKDNRVELSDEDFEKGFKEYMSLCREAVTRDVKNLKK